VVENVSADNKSMLPIRFSLAFFPFPNLLLLCFDDAHVMSEQQHVESFFSFLSPHSNERP
jgi:hypothetical protein